MPAGRPNAAIETGCPPIRRRPGWRFHRGTVGFSAHFDAVRVTFLVGAGFLALAQSSFGAQLFLIDQQAIQNATPDNANLVNLGWNSSPSTNAAGYYLCYGLASGDCTNRLDVGNVTSATLAGLETNATYYFTVVVYDETRTESPPSNEISYVLSGSPSPTAAPRLAVQLQGAGSSGELVNLTFQGEAIWTYQIEASEDLRRWVTICTTNCAADGVIIFRTDPQNYPHRFYRLLRR
jgi:hypothetical protein